MAGDDANGGAGGKTWLKILVVVAVAAVMLSFLPGFLEDGANDPDAIWLIGFALVIGAVAFRLGWREFRHRQLIRNTPTSTVRSLAVGAAEVKGEARPADETLTSPISQQDACIYNLEILQYNPGGEDGGDWNTVLEIGKRVSFHVDDGTGAVRVEPEGATVDIQHETTVEVDGGEPPPEGLPAWAEENGFLEMDLGDEEAGAISGAVAGVAESAFEGRAAKHLAETSSRDRRYKEKVLADGETTYVWGGARPREETASKENPRNLVMGEHKGTGTFIVSDRPEAALADEKLFNTVLLLAVGVTLLPYGVLGLLRRWGVI